MRYDFYYDKASAAITANALSISDKYFLLFYFTNIFLPLIMYIPLLGFTTFLPCKS